MDRYREIIETGGPHENAVAFCAANGLDAHEIPAEDGLRIVDNVIHYRTMSRAGSTYLKSEWKTVPLVSSPNEHGLATREVVALELIADRLEDALNKHSGYNGIDDPSAAHLFKGHAAALALVVQDLVATEVSR